MNTSVWNFKQTILIFYYYAANNNGNAGLFLVVCQIKYNNLYDTLEKSALIKILKNQKNKI
jgi:hypothetical protein